MSGYEAKVERSRWFWRWNVKESSGKSVWRKKRQDVRSQIVGRRTEAPTHLDDLSSRDVGALVQHLEQHCQQLWEVHIGRHDAAGALDHLIGGWIWSKGGMGRGRLSAF